MLRGAGMRSSPPAKPLHRVSIDVVSNPLADGVADGDRARIVHAAPDPGVIPVGARVHNARVCPTRLPGRRQRKRLSSSEVAEKNGGRRAVLTWMPGGILRVRRRVDERLPARLGSRVWIAVVPAELRSPDAM